MSAPKLYEVAYMLKPAHHKYFDIGVQLKVSPETLKCIEVENPTISSRFCLTVNSWLNNNSSERCTWLKLADAVERVGDYNNLVQELRERGNKNLFSQQSHCESEGSTKDTDYSKSESGASVGYESCERKEQGCIHVEKIDSNNDLAKKQGNILPQKCISEAEDMGYSTKSISTIAGMDSSSESESESFQLVPGCGCKDKPCSLYTLCVRGCPNPTRKKIPVLQRTRPGVASQDDLPFEEEEDCEDFERETKKIQKNFGKFVTDVCCSFETKKVNIEKLALFLQASFPVLKPRSKELNEASSLEQIFKIVVDQACSWFDYEVIKDTAEYFGVSSKHAEEYEEKFKKYVEKRLPKGQKHIKVGNGAKVGGKQLVVKIDKEWEEVSFKELDALRGSFASILDVHRRDLYLADVREGCMMITFMIQEELAKKLFPTKSCLNAEQILSLKNECFISIRCENLIWRTTSERSEEQVVKKTVNTDTKMNSQSINVQCGYVIPTRKGKLLTSGLSTLIVFILLGTILAGVSLLMYSTGTPQVHKNVYSVLVIQNIHSSFGHTLLVPTSFPTNVTIQLEKYSIPLNAPFSLTESEVFNTKKILDCQCNYQPALSKPLFWVQFSLKSYSDKIFLLEDSHYHSIYDTVTSADECKWTCSMKTLSISYEVVSIQYPQCSDQEVIPLQHLIKHLKMCSHTNNNYYMRDANASVCYTLTEDSFFVTSKAVQRKRLTENGLPSIITAILLNFTIIFSTTIIILLYVSKRTSSLYKHETSVTLSDLDKDSINYVEFHLDNI